MLPRHARRVLSRLRCNGHSFRLSSYLSRIGRYRESFLQRLWIPVPGHFSSHSAPSSYGLFAPLTLWRLSVSLRPLVQDLGSCPASGASWSSAMPPSLGRGRVINHNNNRSSLHAFRPFDSPAGPVPSYQNNPRLLKFRMYDYDVTYSLGGSAVYL